MNEDFPYPIPGSEHGEDAWIEANVPLPAHGFYVDIGAMRPNALSNTWFLRQRGWHGLAIDGHPECAEHWNLVENCGFLRAVISGSSRRVKFLSDRNCSRITDAAAGGHLLELAADSLGDAFKAWEGITGKPMPNIDFLSLDIEGEEYAAMTTFDFGRFTPQVIVAEYATLQPDGSVKADFRLRELLLTNGYIEAHRTVANIIYLKA